MANMKNELTLLLRNVAMILQVKGYWRQWDLSWSGVDLPLYPSRVNPENHKFTTFYGQKELETDHF